VTTVFVSFDNTNIKTHTADAKNVYRLLVDKHPTTFAFSLQLCEVFWVNGGNVLLRNVFQLLQASQVVRNSFKGRNLAG
jgi:hypothetical protein